MYKNIVVLDLWTDANRGDESLQAGLIKMLRLKNPEAKITGIFRFGHNEIEDSRVEISATIELLDIVLGGLRRTSYAGARAKRNLIYLKLHNLLSFFELFIIFTLYKLSGTYFFSKSQKNVANALKEAELVVWKGKNFRPPQGIAGIPRQLTLTIAGFIAGVFSKKFICVNASFWKVKGLLNIWLMKKAFSKCSGVTVRDQSSVANTAYFIKEENISYCKDLSYFDIYDRLTNQLQGLKKEHLKYDLAITITKWGSILEQKKYLDSLCDLIDYVIKNKPDAAIVIVPQVIRKAESSDDLVVKISAKYHKNIEIIDGPLSINELLVVYSNSKILIGTRMHSCVFAAAVGTPFVAIAYDFGPKWEILRDLVNDFLIIPINEINGDILLNSYKYAKLKDFSLKEMSLLAQYNVAI